jgi:hypothetical protein
LPSECHLEHEKTEGTCVNKRSGCITYRLATSIQENPDYPVAGFCYQHITLADDNLLGYCVHCYNAAHVEGCWIFLDARGNTGSRQAPFSLGKPVFAYPNRSEYNEYFWKGIYASLQIGIARMLDTPTTWQDVIDNLQD